MDQMQERENILSDNPRDGIYTREGKKFITELDSTKMNVIDRYEVGKALGKGGFATVYEITSVSTGKKFAGKVVDKKGLSHTKFEKFKSEVRINMSLDHPHVCKMFKHFEDNRYHFLILELCSNNTLAHLLKKRKVLTEPEAQYFLLQIIDAISYLHSKGVIHRDLKLTNIFLDDNLEVKVGDLGLAAQLSEPNERKKTMCGTPSYIAPEVLAKAEERAYSYEVDIWSIGVIAYNLLVGKNPYDGGSLHRTYDNIRENHLEFPLDSNLVSHSARLFIRALLTTDPSLRPTLDQMIKHPFFTDSPTPPPQSLPLYILKSPYLLTSRPVSTPTPVIQRVARTSSEEERMTGEDGPKRLRMGDIYPSHPTTAATTTTATTTATATGHHPTSTGVGVGAGTELVTGATRPVVQMDQLGQAGMAGMAGRSGQDYANRYHPYGLDPYERDGNGRNNINRFSLNAQRNQFMEDRIDIANQSFHELRGLQPNEIVEGLPIGIIPSITVARDHYVAPMGSSYLVEHAANLHTALHLPNKMISTDHIHVQRTPNWIVDEYDFTKKYGIGYMFSNGNIGVYFNDKTTSFNNLLTHLNYHNNKKIILSSDGRDYEYYTRCSVHQWNVGNQIPCKYSGYIDDYPAELGKKITLVKYFRANFLERMTARDITKEETEDSARGGPRTNIPFVIKWVNQEAASFCFLSTGAIVVRFDGGTIMNLEPPFDDLTYFDKYGIVTSMPLEKAVKMGRDDIMRRLNFICNHVCEFVKSMNSTRR